MTGGDDFSEINVLLDGAVYIAGTQTITGDKTFTGSTVMDGGLDLNGFTINTNTIENTGSINNLADIFNDGTITNYASGLIKNDGIIENNNQLFLTVGSIITASSENITPDEVSYLAGASSNLQDQINLKANDDEVVHLVGTETITGAKTFENNNFTVRTATLGDRIAVNSSTITITPSTTTGITMTPTLYQSDFTAGYSFFTNAVEKLALSATESWLRNATNIFLQIGTTTKQQITATATTLTNTTTSIVSGVLTKLSINATATTLTNDTINLTGSSGFNISNTTGALRLWSPTMSFGYDTLLNTVCSIMSFESLGGVGIGFNLDGVSFGNFNISDNTTTYVAIDNAGMYLQNAEVYVDGGTVIRLDSPQNILTNTAGTNTIDALTTGTNTIRSVSGANTITSTTGRNTLTTANTTATANLITATGALGGNTMRTTTGDNNITVSGTATSNGGSNVLEVAGGNGGNILRATGAGTSLGGYNSIVGRNNYYDAQTGGHYIRTGVSPTDRLSVFSNQVNINNPVGALRYFTGTSGALTTPLLTFQLAGVKRGTATSGALALQPQESANTTNVSDYFAVPCRLRFLRWTIMYDNDSGANTNLSFTFTYKVGNAGTEFFYHTETFTTIVSTARANTQTGSINGTTGLDYAVGDIMGLSYSGAPANEFGVVFYAQQI